MDDGLPHGPIFVNPIVAHRLSPYATMRRLARPIHPTYPHLKLTHERPCRHTTVKSRKGVRAATTTTGGGG